MNKKKKSEIGATLILLGASAFAATFILVFAFIIINLVVHGKLSLFESEFDERLFFVFVIMLTSVIFINKYS